MDCERALRSAPFVAKIRCWPPYTGRMEGPPGAQGPFYAYPPKRIYLGAMRMSLQFVISGNEFPAKFFPPRPSFVFATTGNVGESIFIPSIEETKKKVRRQKSLSSSRLPRLLMNHFRRVLGPLDVNTLSSETRWKRNQSDVADVRRGDNMAARSSWKKPFFSFFL